MGIARADRAPAANGLPASAARSASVQTAVAGMSLITWTTCESSSGLVVMSDAAMTPAVRLCSRAAST